MPHNTQGPASFTSLTSEAFVFGDASDVIFRLIWRVVRGITKNNLFDDHEDKSRFLVRRGQNARGGHVMFMPGYSWTTTCIFFKRVKCTSSSPYYLNSSPSKPVTTTASKSAADICLRTAANPYSAMKTITFSSCSATYI
jgi:hypothetical protein